MAEIVEFNSNGVSTLMEYLETNKDNVENIVLILDFKDEEPGLLLHNGVDLKTLCYMTKILDQLCNDELDGDIEPL
jgi:hypothetical protein